MDSVIGPLFVILMLVISIAGKIQERKRAKEEQQKAPRIHAEDLPPATRRAIYGSSDVPVARAKDVALSERSSVLAELERAGKSGSAAMPERTPSVFEPRTARPAPTRPMAARPPQTRPTPPRPVQTSRMQRPPAMPQRGAPTLRERAQDIRAQIEKALQQAVEEALPPQAPPPVRRTAPRSAAPRRAVASPAPEERSVAQPRHEEAAPVHGAGPRGHRRRSSRGLFANMNDVRRGIVMSEILGPPKALR